LFTANFLSLQRLRYFASYLSSSPPGQRSSCSDFWVEAWSVNCWPNRSDQALRSNRYFHFIFANCRPDTARRRKIIIKWRTIESVCCERLGSRGLGGVLRLTRKQARGCNEHAGRGSIRSDFLFAGSLQAWRSHRPLPRTY